VIHRHGDGMIAPFVGLIFTQRRIESGQVRDEDLGKGRGEHGGVALDVNLDESVHRVGDFVAVAHCLTEDREIPPGSVLDPDRGEKIDPADLSGRIDVLTSHILLFATVNR
jgi:hypothetical protein